MACENKASKKILCKACQPKNFHLSDDWLCETHENKCSDSNAKDISLEYLDRFLKRYVPLLQKTIDTPSYAAKISWRHQAYMKNSGPK